jgi:hypothetical protein
MDIVSPKLPGNLAILSGHVATDADLTQFNGADISPVDVGAFSEILLRKTKIHTHGEQRARRYRNN